MMRIVTTGVDEQRAPVPTLDRINALMDGVERAGREPRGLVVGNVAAGRIARELLIARNDDRYTAVDPIEATELPDLSFGCDARLWGVPILRVDQADVLAVVTDA